MNHDATKPKPGQSTAVCSRVAGWAVCRVSLAQVPSLRGQAKTLQGAPLPASFLKHADEQTVVGMEAVAQAIHDHDLGKTDFSQWGVIAAPRFLGRAALAVALARFAAEGAWGLSPHLIPHHSQHAMSGTISLALKTHGPNYGVGGGWDAASEALLAAAAVVASSPIPGLWVLLTGFDPEVIPADPLDDINQPPVNDCVAVALALVPSAKPTAGDYLTVGGCGSSDEGMEEQPPFSLEDFAATLGSRASSARWSLPCGGWAVWEHVQTAAEICL